MTIVERELAVSLALLGAFFGSLLAGPSSDQVGRKPVIIVSSFLFLIGTLVMTFAATIATLMIGRLIVGLGVGIASMIVPVYLSELSPTRKRGGVVAIFVVAITVGQLLATVIALLCGRNWRLMIFIAAIPAGVQLIWMFFMPESPRFLARKLQNEQCLCSLRRVYPEDQANLEL
jgi:SP family myo-inositol transporter-like MFS transporter 13